MIIWNHRGWWFAEINKLLTHTETICGRGCILFWTNLGLHAGVLTHIDAEPLWLQHACPNCCCRRGFLLIQLFYIVLCIIVRRFDSNSWIKLSITKHLLWSWLVPNDCHVPIGNAIAWQLSALFTLIPLDHIIRMYPTHCQCYADDIQLYFIFKPDKIS